MARLLNNGKHKFMEVKTIPVGYKIWSIPSIGVGNIPPAQRHFHRGRHGQSTLY